MNRSAHAGFLVVFSLLLGWGVASAGDAGNAVHLPFIPKGSEGSMRDEFSASVNGSTPIALGFKGKVIPSTRVVSFPAAVAPTGDPVMVDLKSTSGIQVGTAAVKITGEPSESFTLEVAIDDAGFALSAHWNRRFISAEILTIFNDAKQGAMSSDRSRVISSAQVAVDLKAADLLADCLRNKSCALRLEAWKTVEAVDGMLLRKAVSLILHDDAAWDPAVDPGQKAACEEFLAVVFKTCRTWVGESGNRVDSLGLGTPEARRDLAGKIFGKTRVPTTVPVPTP